jgi:uncharacterized protein (TIGR02599 family)
MRRLSTGATPGNGFTLVELLVSMTIVALLLVLLVSITNSTEKIWTNTTAKVTQFQDAREAYEAVTQKLSEATLNTYLDYQYPSPAPGATPNNTLPPTGYTRQSELRFISGPATSLLPATIAPTCPTHAVFFQAPLGYSTSPNDTNLNLLLNTCGYYIQFGSDTQLRPTFITTQIVPYRYRFRLIEYVEPTNALTLYQHTNGMPAYNGTQWFTDSLNGASPPVQVRAENIIALVILPRLAPADENALIASPGPIGTALSPTYSYDSTLTYNGNTSPAPANAGALDPKNQLTMVAVDETSYARFQGSSTVLPSSLGLANLFTSSTGVGSLTNASVPGYAQDLQTLETNLQTNRLPYRVFTTNVSVKNAKWDRTQTN